MATVTITLTSSETTNNLNPIFANNNTILGLNSMINYYSGLLSGSRSGSLSIMMNNGNAAQASGTATLTGVQAGDILLINGVSFTAVSSGATGNQFNIGGSDTITTSNLVSAINNSTSLNVSGLVTASSSSNVITVTTTPFGTLGNNYDLEGRGSGAIAVTGSGVQASATLTCNNAGVAGDTFTINGITFTGVAAAPGANQYLIGGSATATATNIVTSVNASVSAGVSNFLFASSSGAIVTLKADRAGIFGNEFTLTAGQASITASGARFTGGTDSAVVNFTGGVNDTSALTYKVS